MNKSLPARALFYAVIVSVFVATISGAMLLSSYHQHMLVGYYQIQERLIDNCKSGVELVLGAKVTVIPKMTLDLFQQEKDSVRLEQKAWGLLDVAAVKSWSGQGMYRDSMVKTFLVGKEAPNYALRLSEGTSPLYVCGTTRVVGAAFLPREGVERGAFNVAKGSPYTGDKLIYGKTELVKPTDMNIYKERFEDLRALQNLKANISLEQDSILQPFNQPTLILESRYFNTVNLVLKGNIIVVASERIEVSANSTLEDVLLVAPKIIIQSGFQGTIQAFAWDSLVVETGVFLDFPSVLSLLPYEERTNFSPEIVLQEGAEMIGTLMVPSFRYNTYISKVTIEPTAKITGQVFVNGVLQHKGIVFGSVFCTEFLLQTPAGVYENYLLDATIDRSLLPKAYLTPSILGVKDYKQVLKYL
ncbi:MAG: hypothetical protein JKY03_01055 [Aureispira sp.]|nr:hypothetical protein [Aureispira sp.]